MLYFIKKKAEDLFSGYFAMVMATGALSIGSYLLGMHMVAKILVGVNVFAYVVLWLLTIIRLIYYPAKVFDDLTSHAKGAGYFTLIAGTTMLGSQLIVVLHHHIVSIYLYIFAIILWFIIMYTFFTAVTIRKNKPAIEEGINGAWLIAAVATQSVSILGTLLAPYTSGELQLVLLFYTLAMYLLGCMLYLNIMTLIFYRLTFIELKFKALTPPYWINMGAVAITTLAGSMLLLNADLWEMLEHIGIFLKGFTLLFWIAGTWWIPLLFILGIWRHVVNHYPLSYDPQYWGMVFPLAMYTAGTYQLSKALDLSFLMVIPNIMVFIAMVVWFIVFVGLIHHVLHSFRKRDLLRRSDTVH